MSRAVVIGAGVAGLATAALLARDGHEVTVLERNDRIGGRAGTVERDGFRFDTGPSWYLMPEVFDRFFALMGTSTAEQLDLRTLDPAYRVYREPTAGSAAESVTMSAGVDRVSALFESVEPGSAAVLGEYLRSARRANRLAVDRFLYNPFTSLRELLASDVLRAAPELARMLGQRLSTFVERRFRTPILRQVLQYPAIFLGTDPRRAPAMYHLMSTLDLDEGVQYPDGGFWHLVTRIGELAVDAGVTVRTEAEAVEIETEQVGPRRHVARGVRWRDRTGVTHVERADVVVSAADVHHTETALLRPEARSRRAGWWRRQISGPGAVIAMLGVDGSLDELPHHTLFFTRDWDANFDAVFGADPRVPDPASFYVCRPSATDGSVAPAGKENLFVLVPVPADVGIGAGGADRGGDATVESVVDAALDRISEWAGVPGLHERVVVRETLGPADFAADYNAWRGGMLGPAHVLSQSAMFRTQNASRRVSGLYYAGGSVAPGVGVPMCLISAELVLKHVRGDRSAGPSRARQSEAIR